MPLPAAVVFDNDGLVLDTEIVWTRAEELLFERRGREFTAANKIELVGSAGAAAKQKLTTMLEEPPEHGTALMAELNELVLQELAHGCVPMPGALALIEALGARDVPLGLCSNSPRGFVDLALAGGGLTGAFATTLAGNEVTAQKPDPEPYATVCAILGADPEACIALEDSPTGCTSARAAGMHVIGVPSVAGVELAGIAHEIHDSLEHPALWASLGLDRG